MEKKMRSIMNESDFDENSKKMIAVKFWASWCGPCKAIEPNVQKMEKEFENVDFVSVDVDQVPALAKKYKIKSLPSLLLIKGGNEINRINGNVLIEPLRKAFRDLTKDEE
jgi:thioredoxin 1